jgi:hypothetical protein
MSRRWRILDSPERVKRLAADMAARYETLCAEKTAMARKAMTVRIRPSQRL